MDIHTNFMLRKLLFAFYYYRFAEIYNEQVYDLLNSRNEKLTIINNGDDVIVKGLSERRVRKRCFSKV